MKDAGYEYEILKAEAEAENKRDESVKSWKLMNVERLSEVAEDLVKRLEAAIKTDEIIDMYESDFLQRVVAGMLTSKTNTEPIGDLSLSALAGAVRERLDAIYHQEAARIKRRDEWDSIE